LKRVLLWLALAAIAVLIARYALVR